MDYKRTPKSRGHCSRLEVSEATDYRLGRQAGMPKIHMTCTLHVKNYFCLLSGLRMILTIHTNNSNNNVTNTLTP